MQTIEDFKDRATRETFINIFQPNSVDELVLPERILHDVRKWVEQGVFPSMLLHSPRGGVGKTALGHVLHRELNISIYFINGSIDKGINDIRKVVEYLNTPQVVDAFNPVFNTKTNITHLVFIDEIDRLTPDAQDSLKGVMDMYPNARFIFTTNKPHNIIAPLKDAGRVYNINFTLTDAEIDEIRDPALIRALEICNSMGLEYDDDALVELVNKTLPTMRMIVLRLELAYLSYGKVTQESVDLILNKMSIKPFIVAIKNFDIAGIGAWVSANMHMVGNNFYIELDRIAGKLLDNSSFVHFSLILSQSASEFKDNEILYLHIQALGMLIAQSKVLDDVSIADIDKVFEG